MSAVKLVPCSTHAWGGFWIGTALGIALFSGFLLVNLGFSRLWFSNLRPLLKGETLKKWLGDIFKIGLGTFFKKVKKMVYFFKLFWKKGPCSNWVWKNTHPGARAQVDRGQGPGPTTGWGIIFKLSLKMDPVLKIVWKHISFFKLFLKTHPRPIFENVTKSFFQSFTFS